MMWECELDSSGSGFGPVVDSSKHSNEPREFPEQLIDYQLLKDSTPWS
jgi:hypothetical protein